MRALLAAAALTAALASPASAAPPDPPEVAYQSGRVVHLPDGSSVTLPARGPLRGPVEVLGRRGGEWVVVVDGSEPVVLAVRGSRVRTVWEHTYDEDATGYQLVRGAAQVVERDYTRTGTTEIRVFDLDGEVLGSRSWDDYVGLVDADAEGLLVSTGEATVRWAPGSRPEAVAPAATYADPARDLLFVRGEDGVGPTSLSAPGTPAWSADLDVEAVSRDGAWVAGATYGQRPRLVVRRLSDGTEAPVPPLRLDRDSSVLGLSHVSVAFERDGDVLAVVGTGGRRWVVRCTVAGACERATAPAAEALVFVPR